MPATSSKLTVWDSDSTRFARERPNWPSTPPPAPPAPAARRKRKMNRATSRIVGPNENRIVCSSERLLGDFALMTTLFVVSSERAGPSLANVGISVSKSGRLVALVLDLLLELALDGVALGGDLLDVVVADLREESRVVGDPDALLGGREDRDEQPVEHEQPEQDRDEAATAPRDHRWLLGCAVGAHVAGLGSARRARRGRGWRAGLVGHWAIVVGSAAYPHGACASNFDPYSTRW